MNREIQMTHTLKMLLAVLTTVVILGGGVLGWVYYNDSLATKQASNTGTVSVKKASASQIELNTIQGEIQKSDDIDISDLDNTSDLDKIDLSGI
ncbi:MAG: hypothetical protein Q7S53_00970 [bacterium]|nr:hypothetical protein [bacterium]